MKSICIDTHSITRCPGRILSVSNHVRGVSRSRRCALLGHTTLGRRANLRRKHSPLHTTPGCPAHATDRKTLLDIVTGHAEWLRRLDLTKLRRSATLTSCAAEGRPTKTQWINTTTPLVDLLGDPV